MAGRDHKFSNLVAALASKEERHAIRRAMGHDSDTEEETLPHSPSILNRSASLDSTRLDTGSYTEPPPPGEESSEIGKRSWND